MKRSSIRQIQHSKMVGHGKISGVDRQFFGKELEEYSSTAETHSAPGDLSELPRTWHYHMDSLQQNEILQISAGPSNSNQQRLFKNNKIDKGLNNTSENDRRQYSDDSKRQRRKGHLRGTRSNGFASGPPFPKFVDSKRRERLNSETTNCYYDDDWYGPLNEKQKQQQMALIEHEISEMANETLCGIGKWRPKWLQRFAHKEWMLILMCWFCLIQGLFLIILLFFCFLGMIVSGLVPSSISTIERRFQFSTSVLGRILQFYEFGYVLFCIPVSYFGGRHSKSTVLGIGLFIMSLGSFIFTLPHFIADPYTSTYQNDAVERSRCYLNDSINSANTSDNFTHFQTADFEALKSCSSPENQPGSFRFVFLFCLAHFMHGIGATPLFTIGISYIDENVGPALSSLYIGIFYAFVVFGPAIGFFMSSKFLLWHTDFMVTGQKLQKLIIDLDETDPKWVGAWYIGFILASIFGLLAVFPILTFPKLLPESLKWHRTRLQEETMGTKKRTPECCGIPPVSSRTTAAIFTADGEIHIDDEFCGEPVVVQFQSSMPALKNRQGPIWYQFWLDVRHIPIAIYKILLNGPFMLITFGMAVCGLIVAGCSTFMSTYLERQFGVAPSKATLFMGSVMVPMAGFGTMISGMIIHKFRLSCVRTLQYCIALVLCALLLSPMYFIYCDHDQLVGIERHYPVDDSSSNHYDPITDVYIYKLNTKCNSNCQCSMLEYHPVCAEHIDGSQLAFYSPCYAGCPLPYASSIREYTNCSCVPDETKGGVRRVKRGFCESKCRGLFAFLVFFAPFCFFTFAVFIALITVVLRTVDYDERSFALGIQWILVRVIGTIPAPVVFGWLFDHSCIRQHLDPCSGAHGSCMLHHNKTLADLFLTFTIAGLVYILI